MSYSFRGAFNSGFKSSFNKSSFNFSKSFFNNKYYFNLLNSNQGLKFKINFCNKSFMSKLQTLNDSSNLVGQVTNLRISSGALGIMKNESDTVMGQTTSDPTEALVLLGDICLVREDCKWTCKTRLSTGTMTQLRMILRTK